MLDIFASQVQVVLGVTGSVTFGLHADGLTNGFVVFGQLLGWSGLDFVWSFDQSQGQTLGDVPFDVTVEEPNTGVIGFETDDKVGLRVDVQGVSHHWILWEFGVVVFVVSDGGLADGIVVSPVSNHCLESVAVQMEGMLTGVVVVQHDFNDLVFFQDEGVGVGTVGQWVCSVFTGTQGSQQSWYLWSGVGDVVEEGVVDTVDQVVHHNVDDNLVVWVAVGLDFVVRNQVEIVQILIQGIDVVFGWQVRIGVVHKVRSSVQLQITWDKIQHGVIEFLHHGVVSGSVVFGVDQDGVTLGSGNVQHVRGVLFRVDTIHFNNGHLVVFDPEVLGHEPTGVDQSQKICGVWLDLPRQVSGIVDDQILRNWFGTGRVEQIHKGHVQLIDILVVPLTDLEDHFLVVFVWEIIVFDNERSPHTVLVLARGMGMVPVRTNVLFHGEVVQEGLAGPDRTLCDHLWTVHLVGAVHEQTMEMQRGVSVGKTVGQVHLHLITFLDPDVGPWELPVARDHLAFQVTIHVVRTPARSPVKSMGCSRNGRC